MALKEPDFGFTDFSLLFLFYIPLISAIPFPLLMYFYLTDLNPFFKCRHLIL